MKTMMHGLLPPEDHPNTMTFVVYAVPTPMDSALNNNGVAWTMWSIVSR